LRQGGCNLEMKSRLRLKVCEARQGVEFKMWIEAGEWNLNMESVKQGRKGGI